MSKTGEIPYGWEEIEDQIREAVFVQASILSHYAPWEDGSILRAYLGVEFEVWDPRDMSREQAASVDLKRHQLYDMVRDAYVYAYQLDGAEQVREEVWMDVESFLNGFPQADWHGEVSPLCTYHDFPLRRMLETYFARWSLHIKGMAISIRELSLLANMTVPAVRTSLSKEGFKLEKWHDSAQEGGNFRLSAGDALLWLSRRRGYIPNRVGLSADDLELVAEQLLQNSELDFPTALSRILEFTGQTAEGLGGDSGLDQNWLQGLLAGKAVATDLTQLRVLAKAVSAPVPEFVGRAVKHLLFMELRSQ